jgi:hypothetical protein
MGRPKSELVLSEDECVQLSSLAGSRSLPHAIVARAKVVLWSVEGVSNSEIATRLGWTNATVGKWRQRFMERRLPGLYDELRPGRPRSIEDEKIATLLKRTLASKPKAGTHWTVRDAAQVSGISKSTVHRLFQAFAVQPHRTRSFKLSTDPFFIEKVRDIVGLYLNPPDHALVLCVDEKSQIQALNRTQPVLPMGLGYVEGVTHDYVATVRLLCSPHWISRLAPCSRSAGRDTVIRSFWHFCAGSMNASLPDWTFTLSSIIMQRTSTRKCAPGWHRGRGTRFTSPQPVLRGLIRWNDGSP